MIELMAKNKSRISTTLFICLFTIALIVANFVHTAHAQVADTAASSSVATILPGYTVEALQAPVGKPASDFVVGPGKSELTIKPGESKTVEILVSNRTGQTRIFNFDIEDAVGSNDPLNAIVLLGDDRGPYTLKDYIRLPQMSIELEDNTRARIPVTITVPADAEPGGRYGSVLVTTATKASNTNEEVNMSPSSAIISRIGTLFFLTIPGDTKIEGSLKSFTTLTNKKVFSQGPVDFQILFENTGDLHISPYGEVSIKNFAGEEVGSVELDPWFAMPRSIRAREVHWNRDFLIGRYEAVATVNRGYNNLVDTQSVYFWVLPWKVIAGIFGVLFLIFFTIRFFAKNFEFKRK